MSLNPPHPEKPRTHVLDGTAAVRAVVDSMRTRIISGLILALPIALTFWIIYQFYLILRAIIDPVSLVVQYLLRFREGFDPNAAWASSISSLIAIILVGGSLYMLGLLAQSSLRRAVDWVLYHLPGVTTIYKAVRGVFQSLESQGQGSSFQRVVLVDYPSSGSKILGFVTKTLTDSATETTILCVCVLTGVVPPAGFTLFVPEENVTDIDWSINQALQAVISSGINAPAIIPYVQGVKYPPHGPIVDEQGHPIVKPAPLPADEL